MRRLLLCLALAIVVIQTTGVSAEDHRLASAGDAYVTYDADAESWTIGTSGISLTVALDPRVGLKVTSVSSPYTGEWGAADAPDTQITLGSQRMILGSRSLVFEAADTTEYRGGVRLDLSFLSSSPPAKVTRSYVCYPQSPIVETWTTFEPAGSRRLEVADLNAFELTVHPGVVRWVSGIETPAEEGGPFTVTSRDLKPGASLTLGSATRSTRNALPWLLIDAGEDKFFGGIAWSGSWQARVARSESDMRVTFGLPPFTTEADGPLETPHAFFGVVGGSVQDVSEAVRAFVTRGIRQGRPFQAPVTYNTWFAYGTTIDHEAMLKEIDLASDLGVEVFVLDAGWYPNNPDDPFDYTTGLGTWDFDPERFPHGLRALRDYTRDKGMRFGLWVEPERVALSTADRPYLAKERWLAKAGDKYFSDLAPGLPNSAQVCLADPEAWQWVFDRLVEVIDTVRPDYLKWDNNAWVNCDRPGHGHRADDGNFAHVRGLYELLKTLRERHPDLLIENCSGGGRRLDFGMLEYTDLGWMDDQTVPAARVRHNIEGLSTVLPPAYLFSFVVDTTEEPIDPFPGLSLFFRSRMPGTLGVTWRYTDVAEGEREWIRREIEIYKRIRDIVRDAGALLLTEQVPVDGGSDWDALQQVSASSGDALIFAFAGPEAASRIRVRPRELRRDTVYEISSVDHGVIASASGAVIMDEGLEIARLPDATAYVLILKVVGQAQAPGVR